MALVSCVECDHAISPLAAACPRCGCPDPAARFVNTPPPAGEELRPATDNAVPPPRPSHGFCARCGREQPDSARFCPRCGTSATSALGDAAQRFAGSTFTTSAVPADRMVDKIADYERVSAIIWLVFGIVQVISVVAIIAGIWNIFAALSRFKLIPLIRARNPEVPAIYESITQLIVIGVVNVLFGGVIGIVFVAFDFYVRSLVLDNQHLFAEPQPAVGVKQF